MASLLIGYDLNKGETSDAYKELIAAIERTFAARWHCLDSTWIVKTELTCVQVRDLLRPHIDANDEFLVAKLTGEAAWTGFNQACSDWLKDNL